jgi:hypothetical protein
MAPATRLQYRPYSARHSDGRQDPLAGKSRIPSKDHVYEHWNVLHRC